MISMRRAFTKHTTARAYLQTVSEGSYNEYNEWEEGALSQPIPINVTPKPVGDIDAGATFGAQLEARPEGERVKEYMKFYSTTEMPMNSFINYNDREFKVVSIADYTAAQFYCVTGEYAGGKS